MTHPMPSRRDPEDERFVYVVTAAGVEALRQSAAVFDREREALAMMARSRSRRRS